MNPSIAYIRSSDGSGDASLMTITQVRTAPATTITVNTVAGAPTNFFATMGTPHTFTDPVTGEIITVISEATAVNFAGRVDSGKVEIVAIAPGETDLGSKVGDIIIIRPTTQWADNIYGVLSKSLNDDGTLKNKSVTAQNVDSTTFNTDNGWGMNNIKNNTLSQGTGYFTIGGLQICYGQDYVSKSGSTVTYPKAFKAGAQPRIVATVADTNQWSAWVKPTPNSTSFVLAQSYADASLLVNWIAIAEAP